MEKNMLPHAWASNILSETHKFQMSKLVRRHSLALDDGVKFQILSLGIWHCPEMSQARKVNEDLYQRDQRE
jgi:hypothetical protein